MSLKSFRLDFLAIKPKAEIKDGNLVITSSWLAQGLLLMGFARKVIIDPVAQSLTLHRRIAWVGHKTVEVPFENIRAISYQHMEWIDQWSFFHGRTDAIDSYMIGLEMINPSRSLHLFGIVGESSHNTGLSGILIGGDNVFDFHGDQDLAGYNLVSLLQKFLKKPMA